LQLEAGLPRYYFHLFNGEVLFDEVGQDFSSLEDARAGAIRGISELIAEHLAQHKSVDLAHRIEVSDDSGTTVDRVVFGELFIYRGAPLRLVDQ
jgi:hypothetical protein